MTLFGLGVIIILVGLGMELGPVKILYKLECPSGRKYQFILVNARFLESKRMELSGRGGIIFVVNLEMEHHQTHGALHSSGVKTAAAAQYPLQFAIAVQRGIGQRNYQEHALHAIQPVQPVLEKGKYHA